MGEESYVTVRWTRVHSVESSSPHLWSSPVSFHPPFLWRPPQSQLQVNRLTANMQTPDFPLDLSTFTITSFTTHDIRFPTSLTSAGSDAIHSSPDYTAAYCILYTSHTSPTLRGHGLTFTLGHGTTLITSCIRLLAPSLLHRPLSELLPPTPAVISSLVSPQLRWLGPSSGVLHLAKAAVVNALWDLWAKCLNKPLWQAIIELPIDKLLSTLDFTYLEDFITPEDVRDLIKFHQHASPEGKYPDWEHRYSRVIAEAKACRAYTTSAGWLGYSDNKIKHLLELALKSGFSGFKIKISKDLDADKKRLKMVRDIIGPNTIMMIDANQIFSVSEAISHVTQLAEFKPWFIEEPTSPYDVLGHATIRRSLAPLNIEVATGEMVANPIMFKQLLQSSAVGVVQIDACRLAGVGENILVMAMARKAGVKVIPHSGGVGLTEMTTQLSIIDWILWAGLGGMVEFLEGEEGRHHVFINEGVQFNKGWVITPVEPGYGVQMKDEVIKEYDWPEGSYWQTEEGKRVSSKWSGEFKGEE